VLQISWFGCGDGARTACISHVDIGCLKRTQMSFLTGMPETNALLLSLPPLEKGFSGSNIGKK